MAKTKLIIPQITRTSTPPQANKDDTGNGSGGNGKGSGRGDTPPAAAQTEDELRRAYISKLIGMLGNVDDDSELMTRIEKLLALGT